MFPILQIKNAFSADLLASHVVAYQSRPIISLKDVKYSDCCVYFKGVYCIIDATSRRHGDGGRAVFVSGSGAGDALSAFTLNSLSRLIVSASIIPSSLLRRLIKRAFSFFFFFFG